MKKRYLVLIGIGILFLGSAAALVVHLNGMQGRIAAYHETITFVDITRVPDGRYEGKYSEFPVSVHLSVTVSGGKITRIDIIDQTSGPGYDALGTINEIIRRQSPLVDAETGATSSSKAIMNAVYRSVSQLP